MPRILVFCFLGLVPFVVAEALLAEDPRCNPADPMAKAHIYPSNGVHNDCFCDAPGAKCDYSDQEGRPEDPIFPEYWISHWTMYQVFQHFEVFPPPYANPPEHLEPSDYRVSRGTTFYDDGFRPADGDGHGAMMEYYGYNQCLPIFPMRNDFSCAFVSLGNKAYFLNYGKVEVGPTENGALPPRDVEPSCCQFSLFNHPPRRDFIQHLPYSPTDSKHLGDSLRAYAWTPPGSHILFAYAFYKDRSITDPATGETFLLPQSFYFSGQPTDPPDAPIVSQNYEDFRIQQPSERVWGIVEQACPAEPKWCCLFATDCPKKGGHGGKGLAATEDTTEGATEGQDASVNTDWSNLRPVPEAREGGP